MRAYGARASCPEHQGTHFNQSEVDPEKKIRYLRNKQLDAKGQRLQLDLIQDLNRDHMSSFGADAFLEGRIQAMETAYRMQFAALDTFDVRKEPAAMREEYGTTPYANGCLRPAGWSKKVSVTCKCFTAPAGPGTITRILITTSETVPTWIVPCRFTARPEAPRTARRNIVIWGGEFDALLCQAGDGRDHNRMATQCGWPAAAFAVDCLRRD